MTKAQYKILKYIHKNPDTTKSELLEKFPDFEKYETGISEYAFKEDKNGIEISELESKLYGEADKLNIPVGKQAEYVKSKMPEDD